MCNQLSSFKWYKFEHKKSCTGPICEFSKTSSCWYVIQRPIEEELFKYNLLLRKISLNLNETISLAEIDVSLKQILKRKLS